MEKIKIIKSDIISEIQLDSPPYNVLDFQMLEFLETFFTDSSNDNNTKMIVLSSNISKVFSNGLDPIEIINANSEKRLEIFRQLVRTLMAIAKSGIPIISVCEGSAIAGGAVLALSGNFLIGNKDTFRICFSETKIGLPAPEFVWNIANRYIQKKHLTEILVLGRNIEKSNEHLYQVLNGTFSESISRQEQIDFYSSRFERLSTKTIRETIKAGNISLITSLKNFYLHEDTFSKHLQSKTFEECLKKIAGI